MEFYTKLEPNELKCNLCGWSSVEVDFKDYLASKGYVGYDDLLDALRLSLKGYKIT